MKLNYREYYRRHLPHYQVESSILAITFRLAFSLPFEVIEDLKAEKRLYEIECKEKNLSILEGKNTDSTEIVMINLMSF
jgi:hypothetical protein